jgi:SDR family mycofactocin-dependent oxidoreductase
VGKVEGGRRGRVEGKVAFVTGAARGMGRAHAKRLAEEGADLLLCDVGRQLSTVPYALAGPDDLTETARIVTSTGRRAVTGIADVRRESDLATVVRAGMDAFGRIDILVANAGITGYARAETMSENEWDEMIDVNLKGAWLSAKSVIPQMMERGEGGSLIFISSGLGLKGHPFATHYAAAKHGVVGLMRSLALELAPKMIRANSIHPGGTRTPMAHNPWQYELKAGGRKDATLEEVLPAYEALPALPIPWLEPEDIANAVLWLASDEARYVTGVTLAVDAGWSARPAGRDKWTLQK